ncbi:hypothetical protein [Hymenobacter norwichensis]|uniref:hypothetical protein n=1 Tax=Hymenobacter norwichensis TaxID=223903 RepID=UPI0003B5FC19|nr:hypothetical protein [Hymenobacter norwichensis]
MANLNTTFRYETRVVAFIDILGFKNKLQESYTNQAAFNVIHDALTELQESFNDPMDGDSESGKKALRIDTQTIQVSDSLIISRLAEERGGIRAMIFDCAYAIHTLIRHGFLCRGAITVGKMYHKGSLMFGEAFVRAYQTEAAEKLPIIKFDQDMYDLAKKHPSTGNEEHGEDEVLNLAESCKELSPGVYYLDYFTDYDIHFGSGEGYASIQYDSLRNIIVNGLSAGPSTSFYSKYRWAADQFNLSADRFNLPPI